VEQLLDVLITILPTEVYQPIIIFGVICFFLFFYGTKQWEKYSDFDKIVFSIIFGGFLFYFFTLPFSFFVNTLNLLQIGVLNSNDLILVSNILFFVFVFVLFTNRLIYNKPLNDNKKFLKEIKDYFGLLLIGVIIIDYALFFAFYFSTYKDFSFVMLFSIILFLFGYVVLYFVFISLFLTNWKSSFDSDKRFYFDLMKSKYKRLILLIIVITIGASFVGMFFFNTTTELLDQQNKGLEIPRIETWNRSNLSGIFDVEQHYTIKFSYIPWIKIKPNISLMDNNGKPYYTNSNYTFRGEYEVIINDSKWNTINVSLNGKKRDNNLPRIYKIEKKDFNDTVQRWDIIFTNPYDMYINIYEFDIEKDKQFNQFINYSSNDMDFDKEGLNQTLKNNYNDQTLAIKDVGVRHNSRNLNQSITLFFATNPIS